MQITKWTLVKAKLPDKYGVPHRWKVRDSYVHEGKRIIVTTDRLSAFNEQICTVPNKWQVLTKISAWWFNQTKDIIRNHLIEVIDPNVMICTDAEMFPVEVVVRWRMTWSSSTSIWTHYKDWEREFCGHKLREWYKNWDELDTPLVTPTTKTHDDENISWEQVVSMWLASQEDWDFMSKKGLEIFNRWQEIAKSKWIILADMKLEFWCLKSGDNAWEIILCDEALTPDSWRYWKEVTLKQRLEAWLEPESYDKEYLRLLLKQLGYKKGNIPPIPQEEITTLSAKYTALSKLITGSELPTFDVSRIEERIARNVDEYFKRAA